MTQEYDFKLDNFSFSLKSKRESPPQSPPKTPPPKASGMSSLMNAPSLGGSGMGSLAGAPPLPGKGGPKGMYIAG